MNDTDLDRDERLCARADRVVDASNRAFDLAERQAGTRVGRRAAEISETLADRFHEVNAEIRAGRTGRR
ncbi:hypothetical protein FsymDg_0112 [Candidatus Protofrankia datiscae]|uniref:Uncharacterized protein n=1 Tax=Candidatus Protofrankia datiscae TaxID=2716812 RepID=F8B1T7_9ACTN|nr:hypothetical protein [Candidatus Protofrankia datiscae]AEH07693.1 hypothetical protein FsymDg_0112 [Candidatus Protofrankia datiscae]